jgi:hypothetical protein
MSEAVVADAPAAETPATTEAAAPDAAAAAPPTEAPVEAVAPVEPPVEAPKAEPREFLALKREKQAIFKRDQALKTREKQIEQYDAEIVTPVRQALEKFEDSPEDLLAFVARAKGKTPQEVFDTLVLGLSKGGEPPDPNDEVKKLRSEIAEKEAAEEQRKIAAAEAQAREEILGRVGVYLQARADELPTIESWSDYYELRTHEGVKVLTGDDARRQVHNDLMDLAEAWYTHHNETLDADKAIEKLEQQYLDEDEARLTKRLLKNPKLSKHYAPPTPPPAQTPPAPVAAQPPTNAAASATAGDTTNQASSPRHIPARRAVVPVGAKVVRSRSSSLDEEQAWMERIAKNVRFT